MPVKIIAHRGASKYAPENTMPAFQMAYELGADIIETDVQLTKDRVPILFHDIKINRVTSHKGYIKDFTYDEIIALDVGTHFSKKYRGTSIVSLEHFLAWVQSKSISLNLELKNSKIDYKNLEEIVLEMLEHYQLIDRTILSSFNPKSIQRLTKTPQRVHKAFITSKRQKDLIPYSKEIGADALHIHYRLLRKNMVHQSKKAEIPLRVYTVNKKRHLLKCLHYKCDGIITDVPDKAINIQNIYNQIIKE
ncbi:glycerophosphodiester phosphodiesterase [Cerasibacillus terrae]|uniref:Glycerophosphodiester phosphodiesterase n=1 Tax=Cerasibacillus terrae TaxID=2498845 RepID=A0A5C8P2R8_9BACI|nr:glycerophosphodiester phosphodiesterase family protein [Cerasibacillus terrae]TXL67915.1 glycerophosphodiester phosphodiesterase [Cerasibacillus terrae]